jgi:(1->4)-alpha-D-glucan 1-alpha-D-glucosylmutase
VHFPVYRTYADNNGRDELDQEVIDRALEQARHSVDRTEGALLDVIARWLGGDAPRDASNPVVRNRHRRAITRFQQLTPPLAAKSVEDTAFYRYGRLLSRNEVGADPGQFCISVQEFHEANGVRAKRFPHSMLATATHDHKRGEDTRARIATLSEIPGEWSAAVREWMQLNAALRTEVASENGTPPSMAPHPADELMLYQMLVGAWPIGLDAGDADGVKAFAERIERWQIKALREAKQVSDWVLPNEEYETACRKFLHAVLETGAHNAFLPKLLAWVERVAPAGAIKSLSQTVLRMTSPGVPDLYQGTDFWDFSLVDPDNRRPVDYAARQQALKSEPEHITDLAGWKSGRLKQQIIHRTLLLHAQEHELFSRGEYLPLQIAGPMAAHAIAFARRCRERWTVVIATHLPARVMAQDGTLAIPPDAWKEAAVTLPAGAPTAWIDIFTGADLGTVSGRLLLSEVLALLPVAVLKAA